MLKRIPGLDDESAAVIWTILDRCDPVSPHASFWSSLPSSFGTALGVKESVLRKHLKGCLEILNEALEARKVGGSCGCMMQALLWRQQRASLLFLLDFAFH